MIKKADLAPIKSTSSILDRAEALNAIVLKEEELLSVLNNTRWAHDIGMCSLMTGWFAEKNLREAAPDKADAILARLQALSMILENDELKCWLPAEEGHVMPATANKALVSAAAVHPLTVIKGDLAFDKESFLRKLLELAEPEGSNRN